MRIAELIVVLLELAAQLAWPSLRDRIARFATGLLSDIPILAGHWSASFCDPSPQGAAEVVVDAHLNQFGRRIEGTGSIRGRPADAFAFNGIIKRNVFYGSFGRKDAHVLAGTGAFVLEIRADSQRLTGCAMWYDSVVEGVWSSDYCWSR